MREREGCQHGYATNWINTADLHLQQIKEVLVRDKMNVHEEGLVIRLAESRLFCRNSIDNGQRMDPTVL